MAPSANTWLVTLVLAIIVMPACSKTPAGYCIELERSDGKLTDSCYATLSDCEFVTQEATPKDMLKKPCHTVEALWCFDFTGQDGNARGCNQTLGRCEWVREVHRNDSPTVCSRKTGPLTLSKPDVLMRPH